MALLTGCGSNASTAESKDEGANSVSIQQETAESIETASQESTDSTATKEEKQRNAELEESARKFKSAENYQESGEYFKAYSLYQKVIEDDSNYTEAQKRAAEMLELYWKQQDDLVEQGEYQTAIENTLDVMSFLNMTSPLDNDMGLEKTILQVAEKLAKTCGFTNPKAEIDENATDWYSKIYSIDIECDGINGQKLNSMSKTKIVQAHNNLSEKFNEVIYRASFGTFCRFLLGDIHNNGKWYSVDKSGLTVKTDAEREKQNEEPETSASSTSTSNDTKKTGWSTGGPGASKNSSKSNSSASKNQAVSQEYKNALSKGLQYANQLHMSKQAIYDQLTSSYGEGFPADAAQYAVDNMTGVDWNANALAKAKEYYYKMSMSKSAVYDQLTSDYGEQFTASQARYAVDHLD